MLDLPKTPGTFKLPKFTGMARMPSLQRSEATDTRSRKRRSR